MPEGGSSLRLPPGRLKALIVGLVFLFFLLIGIGLWDLFRGANALVASIALIFVISGIFNTWSALNEGNRP